LGIPTENVPLDLVNDVIFKGATVQGIYGRRMYETWVQMTALLRAGRLNLEPLFGERAALDKFEALLRCFRAALLERSCYIRTVCRAERIDLCCLAFKTFAHSSGLTQNSSGRVHLRSTTMSDTATIPSKQNPMQYLSDQLKEMLEKGVAPKPRVLEGEQKPVCIFDGREVINLAFEQLPGADDAQGAAQSRAGRGEEIRRAVRGPFARLLAP